MAHRAYLALGTNLGNRLANLGRAIGLLGEFTRIESVSPIYETDPVGFAEQPLFLNQVVIVSTDLSPRELLRLAKDIEARMGREILPFRNGPRTIDVDILFFDDEELSEEDLTIPHPRLFERPFVLVPLSDLAPELEHPSLGKTVAELLTEAGRGGVRRLGREPSCLPSDRLPRPRRSAALTFGQKTFVWGSRTYVVGILNATPDSFSGDGLMSGDGCWVKRAVELGCRHVADGADMLDVGGESSRPGACPVSVEEEISRVIPVIRSLVRTVEVPISIDTCRSAVADAALEAGAHIVNDIRGFRGDLEMARVVAHHNAAAILMHNRSNRDAVKIDPALGGRYLGSSYVDLLSDVSVEISQSLEIAQQAGIAIDRIIIDPGVGFGKTVDHDLELVDRLDELGSLGLPVLIGPSRKSFIGYTLNLPADDRLEGTAAAVAIGIARGADLIRVHDVKCMARVARMSDALVRRTKKSDSSVIPS